MHVTPRGLLVVPVVECLRCELNHIIRGGPKTRIYDRVGERPGCGIPPQKIFKICPVALLPLRPMWATSRRFSLNQPPEPPSLE
nr:MAG TPA: hypothetical protein [Caudoviricetes sp.]